MLDSINALVNTKVTLEPSSHTYRLSDHPGIKFNNVTGIVEGQFPPFEKEKIAKALTNRVPKYQHLTWEELVQEWEDAKNHGTAVHKELEDYLRYGQTLSLDKAISGKECYEYEIKDFGDKVFPEVIVYSKELKVAGTVDLLVYNSDSNECHIFDWKTSKKIDRKGKKRAITSACSNLSDCRYDQYSLQLSIYSYLLEKYHNIIVNEHYMVHLMDDDYDLIAGQNLQSNVVSIFTNYNTDYRPTSYKQSSSSSTEAVSSTNVSRTAYKKSVSTKKSGLHDEGTTTYYYGTCPHSGCDREFKVMAYFKNNPTSSISIPKHYDCFSCGKSVTYVNIKVGLLTGEQYTSHQQKSQVSAPSSSSLFNRFKNILNKNK